MATSSVARKPIGVRATPEQHRVLTEAAARQHRSVSSFVLTTALEAAQSQIERPKRSRQEILAILRAARAEVQAANPTNRDLVQELLAERRAEATRD
jgi:uncharacterized protein (DUF1778 family)